MAQKQFKTFSVREGLNSLKTSISSSNKEQPEENETPKILIYVTYAGLVLGILFQQIYPVLVQAIKTGDPILVWGSPTLFWIRVVLCLIVAAVLFTGAWNQIKELNPSLRFFSAISFGFAINAFVDPIIPIAPQVDPQAVTWKFNYLLSTWII